jgi:hypothetical protein
MCALLCVLRWRGGSVGLRMQVPYTWELDSVAPSLSALFEEQVVRGNATVIVECSGELRPDLCQFCWTAARQGPASVV